MPRWNYILNAQDVEMGRPSELRVRVSKQIGVVTTNQIDQNCVLVAEDNLRI